MGKFAKAVEEFLNPPPPPELPGIDWDVSPEEIHRVTWAYAQYADCSYADAKEQLSYLTYQGTKVFLGEG